MKSFKNDHKIKPDIQITPELETKKIQKIRSNIMKKFKDGFEKLVKAGSDTSISDNEKMYIISTTVDSMYKILDGIRLTSRLNLDPDKVKSFKTKEQFVTYIQEEVDKLSKKNSDLSYIG